MLCAALRLCGRSVSLHRLPQIGRGVSHLSAGIASSSLRELAAPQAPLQGTGFPSAKYGPGWQASWSVAAAYAAAGGGLLSCAGGGDQDEEREGEETGRKRLRGKSGPPIAPKRRWAAASLAPLAPLQVPPPASVPAASLAPLAPLQVPPPVEVYETVEGLRKGIKLLDVRVPHSLRDFKTNTWRSLKRSELAQIYVDRRVHMEGYNKTIQEWTEIRGRLTETCFRESIAQRGSWK